MVRPGSIWKEPEDWSMALSKKERTLAAWWEGHGVVLTAVGLDRESGGLHLSYESKDFEACLAELKKSERSVF